MIRIFFTALVGLLVGIFIGIDLVLLGIISLDSVFVSLIALLGFIGGGLLGRRRTRRA